jgi:kynurenine formamidase
MPHHPAHPPFLFGLTKLHGDYTGPKGHSSSSEAIALGGHTGTHIDALCHFSFEGRLNDGSQVAGLQSYGGGLQRLSVDTIEPIVRRGVLLDIAGLLGVEELPANTEITPAHLDDAAKAQGVELRGGEVVLLRTGWARRWRDARGFVSELHGPGPAISGARWLSEHRAFAAGSDTIAFERLPADDMPVHVHLLVTSGIHIIECLNLEEIARDRVHEFLFVALPLKIAGATGSPVRPIAVKLS